MAAINDLVNQRAFEHWWSVYSRQNPGYRNIWGWVITLKHPLVYSHAMSVRISSLCMVNVLLHVCVCVCVCLWLQKNVFVNEVWVRMWWLWSIIFLVEIDIVNFLCLRSYNEVMGKGSICSKCVKYMYMYIVYFSGFSNCTIKFQPLYCWCSKTFSPWVLNLWWCPMALEVVTKAKGLVEVDIQQFSICITA